MKVNEIVRNLGKRMVVPSMAGVTAISVVVLAGLNLGGCTEGPKAAFAGNLPNSLSKQNASDKSPEDSVELNDAQLQAIKTGSVLSHPFREQRTAVGSIDFNENLAVPVFSSYQGKIIQTFLDIGDEVHKGQILYTIDSPDLIQAESNLMATAGVYELTSAALARDKKIYAAQGMALKDLEQAVSDQQTADANFRAAKEAVRVFGKSPSEIDAMVSSRKIDPALVVTSPISGRITARAAQPGLLVQPGNLPAPYSVADVSNMWMLANVSESDSPLFHVGQSVSVKIMAFPDRDFSGHIDRIGATVDPNTHTVLVRSEVRDPKHKLRPGMLATYVIQTASPMESMAVPLNGVVREGDGTMSVWVVKDNHHFVRHTVKIGLQQDGLDQILDGLKPMEKIVVDGAIFISNMHDKNGSTN